MGLGVQGLEFKALWSMGFVAFGLLLLPPA